MTPTHRKDIHGQALVSTETLRGAIGFDVEPGQDVTVSAAPGRRNQLAKNSSKRQRRSLSGCGLRGVRAQEARVTRGRKHTRSVGALLRAPAQIQKLVEAPTPWRQRPPVALKSGYTRERASCYEFCGPGFDSLRVHGDMRSVAGCEPPKSVHQRWGRAGSRVVVSHSNPLRETSCTEPLIRSVDLEMREGQDHRAHALVAATKQQSSRAAAKAEARFRDAASSNGQGQREPLGWPAGQHMSRNVVPYPTEGGSPSCSATGDR